jgi:hypothetical protein
MNRVALGLFFAFLKILNSIKLYTVITTINLCVWLLFCPTARADSIVPPTKEQALTLFAPLPISLSRRSWIFMYYGIVATSAAIVFFSRGAFAFFTHIWSKEQTLTFLAPSPFILSSRIWIIAC